MISPAKLISMKNDMKNILRVLKALGDKNRLRIIKLLQQKDAICVCEFCEVLGISQSTTSRHLRILEEAGLIYSSRDKKWVNYHIVRNPDNEIASSLLSLAEKWGEGDPQVEKDRVNLEQVDREKLCG